MLIFAILLLITLRAYWLANKADLAESNEIGETPAEELHQPLTAVDLDGRKSEPEPAMEKGSTSELESALQDLQQGLGAGLASFQAAFSVRYQLKCLG